MGEERGELWVQKGNIGQSEEDVGLSSRIEGPSLGFSRQEHWSVYLYNKKACSVTCVCVCVP